MKRLFLLFVLFAFYNFLYAQYNNVYAPFYSLHVPMKSYNNSIVPQNTILYGGRTKTYVCPMCNGTGVINDFGNGELITANWWRQTTGNTGDGTYCDGVNAYHDPCDSEWSEGGWTYHHDYKRTCPQCNGSGYVQSNRKPSTLSGWVQWTGESWSHIYTDNDNDGHCDQHEWHKQIPIGNDLCLLLFAGIYGAIMLYKHNRRCLRDSNILDDNLYV